MRGNNNKLPNNLPMLQNLIKRDPPSYIEEFERQHSLYSATRTIFEQNPTVHNRQLDELIMFMAQVGSCYPTNLAELPSELMSLLQKYASVLHPNMRLSIVKALVLLRNKGLLAPTALLVLFFELLRCQDKSLREFLKEHIITDIKNVNSKSRNMRLNKELQNFMFTNLNNNHAVAVKTSLDIMIELYNKKVWNDTKTVNIIVNGCFSKITKVMVAAVKFFLGKDEEQESDDDDSDSDDEPNVPKVSTVKMTNSVNKKTKKRMKQLAKAKKAMKKGRQKKKSKVAYDFSAIHLLHDPQEVADRLFKRLEKMNERFEVKLLVMNFVSRLIGIHQLYVPNFYPLVNRFLFPHQREVTRVMVFAAQAAHPLVPPDDLEPVVKTLANNFVTERHAGEVIAMGINAIRELCFRNPYCMTEDLLRDITEYKTYKDKGVMMATRSLISLFREKNPDLLNRKDRGAPSELRIENKKAVYGDSNAKDYIPGAEVLTVDAPEGVSSVLHIDSDDSDDDGEWIDVPHADGDDDEEKEEEEEEENESEEEDNKAEENGDNASIADSQTTEKSSASQNKKRKKKKTQKQVVAEVMKMTADERATRATEAVTNRFLTTEDFTRIEEIQAAKTTERYGASKKRKKEILEEEERRNDSEVVTLTSIEMVYKKRKHDKESRLATVMKGREGRDNFAARRGRMNPNASTTNKEKRKNKNFMMLKHKVRGKQKRSFRDKQIRLRNSLLKQRRTIIK